MMENRARRTAALSDALEQAVGDKMKCPKCNEDCWQDSVDVGVGIIYGPWGCPCGWSEDKEYDLSTGKDPVDEKGGAIDQYGGYHPPGSSMALGYRLARMIEEENERNKQYQETVPTGH